MAKIELKIIGHEIVTTRVKTDKRGVFEEEERLKVKARGRGGDARTVLVLMTEPGRDGDYPLGEVLEVTMRVPQVTMDLDGKSARPRTSKAAAAAH